MPTSPTPRALVAVISAAALCLAQAPLEAQAPPLPQPSPEAPPKISWSYADWWTILGSSFLGGAAGSVGAVALYWELGGVCAPGQDAGRCLDAHFPSSFSVGLLGMTLGAGTGALTAGTLLGYEGDPAWTYGGAALGLLGFLLPFGGYGAAQAEPRTLLWVGAGISLATVPMLSTLYYYITQPNPARIGDTAQRSPPPTSGWVWLPPQPSRGPQGELWWSSALRGSF